MASDLAEMSSSVTFVPARLYRGSAWNSEIDSLMSLVDSLVSIIDSVMSFIDD